MAFDGTYYKIYEFIAAYVQRNNAGAIAETSLQWPNRLTPGNETVTYEWQGGGQKKKVQLLIAVNWTLDLDAIDLASHAAIFSKAEITDPGVADAYFDVSTLVGFGGGNDKAGVTRGLRLVANALGGATEEVVSLNIWVPVATFTLAAVGGLSAGGVGDKMQYAISATKTAVDITGASIAGASSDGEFFFIGEGA